MVDFNYKKHGNGINKLIFFHGFGEDQTTFDKSIQAIQKEHRDTTCYSIDIYYHGNSQRGNEKLTFRQWEISFRNFLEKESIQSFILLGFSLGGRFALATAYIFPTLTSGIFLIAPDGVFQSPWYRLANSLPGNLLFKYLMNHPPAFDWLVNIFKKTGIISKPLARFVEAALHAPQQRKQVYHTWTYFYPLQLKPGSIARCFNQHEIPVHVILGEKDKIIPPKKVLLKLSSIKDLRSVIVNARHHQMITESTPYVISVLKNQNL
ncbi:MAG: alpha/beta hydrolase [Cyclobacteriaceae bacterium]